MLKMETEHLTQLPASAAIPQPGPGAQAQPSPRRRSSRERLPKAASQQHPPVREMARPARWHTIDHVTESQGPELVQLAPADHDPRIKLQGILPCNAPHL